MSKFSDALKDLGAGDWNKKPQAVAAGAGTTRVAVALIAPDPDQPRKAFDPERLNELAASIQEHGLIQPIGLRVNPETPGHYTITFGERRFRAVQQLGWDEIDALVRAPANPAIEALIENLHRDDLTAWETAMALAQVAESTGKKYNELADLVGKSPAWVSQYLAVRKMPQPFRDAIEFGSVNDITTLNEAYQLYRNHEPEALKLVGMATPTKPVTRDAVRRLASKLDGEDARPKGGKAKPKQETVAQDEAANVGPAADAPPAVMPHIFVADEDGGQEVGYIDLGKKPVKGKAHVVRGAGLVTLESLNALRITRIELG